MPINFKELTLTGLDQIELLDSADRRIGEIYARMPALREDRVFRFVVAPAAAGGYHVVRWVELEEIIHRLSRYVDARTLTLAGLAALTPPAGYVEPGDSIAPKLKLFSLTQLLARLTPTQALDRVATSTYIAQTTRDSHPGKRVVVTEAGQIHGLLVVEYWQHETLGGDPFTPAPRMVEASASAEPPPAEPESRLLDQVGKPAAQGDQRVVNVWVEEPLPRERDIPGFGLVGSRVVKPGEPLARGAVYLVNLNVALPRAAALATVGDLTKAEAMAGATAQTIEMSVQLKPDPAFFTLYGYDELPIVFPRGGVSKNIASFAVEPIQEGVGSMTAVLTIKGKPFQTVTLQLAIGAESVRQLPDEPVEVRGLTLASATSDVAPIDDVDDDASLIIIPETAGYRFMLVLGGSVEVSTGLNDVAVADLIRSARAEYLEKIVKKLDRKRNEYSYQQQKTEIAEEIHSESLEVLRDIGFSLYEGLFFAPAAGADARKLGEELRKISQQRRLRIRVIARGFAFPWALLYDRTYDDPLDPMGFWGYKHVIEYTPQFAVAGTAALIPEIKAAERLQVGFVYDESIDAQFPGKIIAGQRAALPGIPRLAVTEVGTRDGMFKLLGGSESTPQLIYFYCHAVSRLPGEKDEQGNAYTVDMSTLSVEGQEVTLKELGRRAPLSRAPFDSAPLVFINACESAELSPHLYNGLVPYLVARGARGVIGTEVLMPAFFAAEFAGELLRRFAAGGVRLGSLLRDMRVEYLEKKKNVLPLVYALYSNSELMVTK